MIRPSRCLFPAVAFALTLSLGGIAPALAQEASADTESDWHTLQAGEFKVDVTLDGVVESENAWPVSVDLEAHTGSVEVIEGVAQGATVAQGDTLLKFDTEAIERQIAAAELSLATTDAAIEQARNDLKLEEEAFELNLAAAERNHARAEADFERWREIELPLDREGTDVSLAVAQQRLDNAREELTQLERMYRDEDLTEDSEEIVLRRQKHAVEVAEFSLKRAENDYEKSLAIELPRREVDMQERLKRTRAALERATEVAPHELQQKRFALEKRVTDRAEAAETLEDLRHDLEQFTVTAPADGVVYYGNVNRGRWSDAEAVARTIDDQGSFKTNVTILTIVDPNALRVRVNVPENVLYRFVEADALTGYFTPTAFPSSTVAAKVDQLNHISGATYDAVIVAGDDAAAPAYLRPGMNAKVHLTAYEADAALTVPLSAVKHAADGSAYVMARVGEGEQTERRSVALGWRNDSHVEIVDGLEAGDQIKLK
ncbi:MAG: hypothetical protein WD294_15305 [Phycisphaeraceae bacterium]